jgi:hypothetical protein
VIFFKKLGLIGVVLLAVIILVGFIVNAGGLTRDQKAKQFSAKCDEKACSAKCEAMCKGHTDQKDCVEKCQHACTAKHDTTANQAAANAANTNMPDCQKCPNRQKCDSAASEKK